MDSKEQQLMELLGLTARSLTHLTASVTSMSFELLRSDDEVTKAAGRRMIDRMATISSGLDEHWRLIGELTGCPLPRSRWKPSKKSRCWRRLPTSLDALSSVGLMPGDSQDERRWRCRESRAIVLFPRPKVPATNKTETGHDQDSPPPCVPFV